MVFRNESRNFISRIRRFNFKLKMGKSIRTFIVIFLFLAGYSCEKEGSERTWELEMSELETMLGELEVKGVNIDTTHLSVFYHILKEGTGIFPKPGDTLYVSFVGFIPSGRKIEDSRDLHPPKGIWKCLYKPQHSVIGFIDALSYLNKGAEIEMYIPSDRAYGKKGGPNVPPYTTLIYRATMHDVVRPKGN
jgi:FKBP-type peptidyl-prolyl cis-trans isomerase